MKDTSRPLAKGITIDGPTSKDLDDAIWLSPHEDGWILEVSIADVSSGVLIGCNDDLVAKAQAFTRYYADNNKPMLPRELSEDALSLRQGKERPTVTVWVTLDEHLEIVHTEIKRTQLISAQRMTYKGVDEIILGKVNSPHKEMLVKCNGLAQALLEKRRQAGALVIYDINAGWATTEEGLIIKIRPEQQHLANVIIQEFMILTNLAVAEFCTRNDIPVLYRNHVARVAADRQTLLYDFANSVEHPDQFPVETLQRRANLLLDRAFYGLTLRGHWGLNLVAYLHFTSPIRRYADLVCHRMVMAYLEGAPFPYKPEELVALGKQLTDIANDEKDRRAASFEKTAQDKSQRLLKSGKFLRTHSDDFHRVIKTSSRSGELNKELSAAIKERLGANQLLPRDLYFLLLEATHATEAWVGIKKKTFEWVVSHPESAVSIFQLANQEKVSDLPEYQVSQSGPSHQPLFSGTASIVYRDQQFTSCVCKTGVKKNTQQLCCVSLIHIILAKLQGVELEWEVVQTTAEERVLVPVKASSVPSPIVQGNYVSALQEWLAKKQLALPSYTQKQEGLPHAPTITCTCTLILPKSAPVVGTGKGPNKQIAKQNAAKGVYEKVVK